MTGTERYTHGYHEVILEFYRRRTAEVCAAFLLPRLEPGAAVLDMGCGPGTITVGLARRVRTVVGVDTSAEVVESARRRAREEGVDNASFELGSAYDLPFDDDSFDVVYAHQLMQHLSDPVRALREARRVLRPGGLVAVRDSDYPDDGPRAGRISPEALAAPVPRGGRGPTAASPTPGASCPGGCGPPASWTRWSQQQHHHLRRRGRTRALGEACGPSG